MSRRRWILVALLAGHAGGVVAREARGGRAAAGGGLVMLNGLPLTLLATALLLELCLAIGVDLPLSKDVGSGAG